MQCPDCGTVARSRHQPAMCAKGEGVGHFRPVTRTARMKRHRSASQSGGRGLGFAVNAFSTRPARQATASSASQAGRRNLGTADIPDNASNENRTRHRRTGAFTWVNSRAGRTWRSSRLDWRSSEISIEPRALRSAASPARARRNAAVRLTSRTRRQSSRSVSRSGAE